MEWFKVMAEVELVDCASVVVEGSSVALFRVGGEIFALDDACSHEQALLSEGDIEDGRVICPKHGSSFDLRTGAVKGLPATKAVRAWATKTEGGWIWVAKHAANPST
jgi:nitrite reductase/ring-hydroxylating ferredoxin subunit